MNGIGLLVLIAVTGQIGLPQTPPFPDPQSQSQPAAQVDSGRNYGWEFDPRDNALCYIVQVTPQQARDMQVPGVENLEFPSDMPAELVGRATRILFRIGNEVLPRTPSLSEIDKMPRFNARADIASALEPGRLRDLEDAVVNVQNDNRMPAFPQGLGGAGAVTPSSNSDPRRGGNLVDQARAGLSDIPANESASSTSDQFLMGAGGGDASRRNPPSLQSPTGRSPAPLAGPLALPSTSMGQSPYSTTDAQGKYQSAPESPTPGANSGNTSLQTGWGASPDDRTRDGIAQNGTGQNLGGQNPSSQNMAGQNFTGQNPTGQTGNNYNGSYNYGGQPGSTGPYDPRSLGAGGLPFTSIPGERREGGRTPVDGFGNYPGGQGDPYAYYTGGQSQSPYGSNAGDPRLGYPIAAGGQQTQTGRGTPAMPEDPSVRLAANTTPAAVLPETGDAAGKPNRPGGGPAPQSDASGGNTGGNTETILQFFFLLSLVVNFYLGMLIRKLLTRYRSLLSSVRGQTA